MDAVPVGYHLHSSDEIGKRLSHTMEFFVCIRWAGLHICLHKQNNHIVSIDAIIIVVRIMPNDARQRHELGMVCLAATLARDEEDLSGAFVHFDIAACLEPRNPRFVVGVAKLFEAQGNYEGAEFLYHVAKSLIYPDIETLQHRAMPAGRYEDAALP